MAMTVLEWLRASTMYSSFEDKHFVKIALDRGVDPDADVYDESLVSKKQKDLMDADLIYMAVLKRPSDTASLSQSHNGYQKTIGSERDFYQDEKIKYAISVYRTYEDERGDILESVARKKIKFLRIVDVNQI
jgi:hypothetical protein